MRGRCSVQFSGGGNSWLTEYHQETSMQDELRNDEILTLMIEGKINRIRYEERQKKGCISQLIKDTDCITHSKLKSTAINRIE